MTEPKQYNFTEVKCANLDCLKPFTPKGGRQVLCDECQKAKRDAKALRRGRTW